MNPPDFFEPDQPIHQSSPRAQLDVMGGVSDFSGGTCLRFPLECATTARAQVLGDGVIRVRSGADQIEIESATWLGLDAREAHKYLEEHNAAQYAPVLGALLVLRGENLLPDASPSTSPSTWGLRLHLDSDVPQGAGVSRSATITVATLWVMGAALGFNMSSERTSRLARLVETEIASASRTKAEFKAVARGKRGQMLRLKCQPAIIAGFEELPQGLQVLGVDSGARHDASGTLRGTVRRARIGAMMGRRILSELVPDAMRGPDGNVYLANISTDIWRALRDRIPVTMRGAEFHYRYGSHEDSATTIHAEEEYAVRLPTEHPIYEADRAARFCDLLRVVDASPKARHEILQAVGELMVQSHFSYAHRLELKSPETDLLVSLARAAGLRSGIYGAKSTGLGVGGTVAFLMDTSVNADWEQVLGGICEEYQAQSGLSAKVLK